MQRYLYRELGSARRTDLHRQIALAMESRADPDASQVAEVARHWLEAVDVEVETALRYSILAGDDALEKLAPDQARRWYEGSLELLARGHGPRDAQRCELLIKRGEAERQAGDRRFRETLLEAAEIAVRIGDEDKLVRAALANSRGMQSETGVVDEGRMETLASALRIVAAGDTAQRARLLAMQAAELMYSREWERRVRLSDEAVAIARRLDDADALSAVLNLRFVTLLAPETLSERQANTVEAVTVAERLSDPLIRFYAYHWRAYACIEAGDILAARSWADRERDIAERFRQPTTLWLRRADEANLAIIAGDLDLAGELATAALEIGQHSEPDAFACFAAQQTSIAFERGTLGELIPVLEQAVRDNPGVPGFRATLALALSEAGRLEEARKLIEQPVASGFVDLPYDVTWLAVACIYAHVSSSLGDSQAARVLYPMLEPWSEQIAFPAFGVWGPVSLYLGSLALMLGDVDAAERHLLAAARAAIRAGAPIWEARAASRLGQLAQMAR
jgi:tetratricopeptide (TPR) repeat protein